MQNKFRITLLSASLAVTSAQALERGQFIDQLDPAACDVPPESIYLDTSARTYDFANALSLSWISLGAIEGEALSVDAMASQWGVTNVRFIENTQHDLKIIIADYQDTVLVTFRHTNSNKNWLYNADFGLWNFDDSFTLGEKTHHGFARMLSAEWLNLLEEVQQRTNTGKGLWVFGHSLGAGLAQLASAGFSAEGLYVDQVYLTGSPKAGSDAWVAKAEQYLAGRVYRLAYKEDLVARLPIHEEAIDEFRTLFSIVPEWMAEGIGNARLKMPFASLGAEVELKSDAVFTLWTETDTVALEEAYWLRMSDELATAKQSTWNPIQQLNRMAAVPAKNLENHLLRSEDGYFCGMINVLHAGY